MGDVAIRVENLSKQYRIGQRTGYGVLRESIADRLRGHKTRQRIRGEMSDRDHIWALKDISFELERGGILGIIGSNGSGKSTLLKILSRITQPTSGRAEIYGRVGALLEVGTGFHPELTGRENVYLSGNILGMRKAEIARKFDEIVAFSGVEQFINTPVKRYSSGMYVRLAFAVAAHFDPEIMFVDEVLAVGDAAFQKKCFDRLETVSTEGRTVVLVSHNAAAIQRLCTRSLLLVDGRIVCDGATHHAMDMYLGRSVERRGERHWERGRATEDDAVRLLHACIRDGRGDIKDEIRSDEPFSVELRLRVQEEGIVCGATVVLYDSDGVCVLSSLSSTDKTWHRRPHRRGVFRKTCAFPAPLLPEGTYNISLLVWGEDYRLVRSEDNALTLHVADAGTLRGDYRGGWSGIVRPALQWTTRPEEVDDAGGSRA